MLQPEGVPLALTCRIPPSQGDLGHPTLPPPPPPVHTPPVTHTWHVPMPMHAHTRTHTEHTPFQDGLTALIT